MISKVSPDLRKYKVAWIFILSFLLMSFQQISAQDLKEDCVGFNPDNIEVKQIKNRWKIVEGSHWILDFNKKKDEANQAFKILKKYGFNHICFVGRPDPSMTYFTTRRKDTTIIIVRHAEKESQPPEDPPLTADGEKRAKTLARFLNEAGFGVSAVFSTNLKRTRETVNNYADSKGIPIQTYTGVQEVTDKIKSQYRSKAVLVAGHADTVTPIMQLLGVSQAPQVGNEFNNLFVVTIRPTGPVTLTHLKYEIDRTIP